MIKLKKIVIFLLMVYLIISNSAVNLVAVDKNPTIQSSILPKKINVLVLSFDPVIEAHQSQKFHTVAGFNDPQVHSKQYADDMNTVSGVEYNIVEWCDTDEFPLKTDGYKDDDKYADLILEAKNSQEDWWNYSKLRNKGFDFDYDFYLTDARFNIVDKVKAGIVDEVWIFGGPNGGMYECAMAGRGAYSINGACFPDYNTKPFAIYGFNYERDVGCMLEDFGHRAECTLAKVFHKGKGTDYTEPYEKLNLWEKFTAYDKVMSGMAGCGNVHFAPNSDSDYDWGNTKKVASNWKYFRDYPKGSDIRETVDCTLWGNGDMRLHHLWWFGCFPHREGRDKDGYFNNWWKYLMRLKLAQTLIIKINDYNEVTEDDVYALEVGRNEKITLETLYSDNSTEDNTLDATWVCSNPGVVVVDNGRLRCLSTGKVVISGKVDGLTRSFIVDVRPYRVLTSLEANLSSLKIGCNEVKKLMSITAVFNDGYRRDVTSEASCAPYNDNIAVGNGYVAGLAEGSDRLVFLYWGEKITIPVTVSSPTLRVPVGDLVENNIDQWGAWNKGNAANILSKDNINKKSGDNSLKLEVKSRGDTALIFPLQKNANWNLSDFKSMELWIRSGNANSYPINSPEIRLCTKQGYISYKSNILNDSKENWIKLTIPFDNGTDWYSEKINSVNLKKIDWIEIHCDTRDYGSKLWVDGFKFSIGEELSQAVDISTNGFCLNSLQVSEGAYLYWRKPDDLLATKCSLYRKEISSKSRKFKKIADVDINKGVFIDKLDHEGTYCYKLDLVTEDKYILRAETLLKAEKNLIKVPIVKKDISINSSKYKVDNSKATISIRSAKVEFKKFISNIRVPAGTAITLLKADGKTCVRNGNVIPGMKLKVTAKEGKYYRIYIIVK